jgi:hypothetical protein
LRARANIHFHRESSRINLIEELFAARLSLLDFAEAFR